jgi:peptidoglycan/LPS O-acetylase OafA/YrhL
MQNISNNERIKVLVGLRAYAFLGMTLFNLTFALLKIPSLPEKPTAEVYFLSFYFFFDIWFMISGFCLSFELSKQWNK